MQNSSVALPYAINGAGSVVKDGGKTDQWETRLMVWTWLCCDTITVWFEGVMNARHSLLISHYSLLITTQ